MGGAGCAAVALGGTMMSCTVSRTSTSGAAPVFGCVQRPVLGPAVGLVMVIDVAQSQACVVLVHDHTHVAADTH